MTLLLVCAISFFFGFSLAAWSFVFAVRKATVSIRPLRSYDRVVFETFTDEAILATDAAGHLYEVSTLNMKGSIL